MDMKPLHDALWIAGIAVISDPFREGWKFDAGTGIFGTPGYAEGSKSLQPWPQWVNSRMARSGTPGLPAIHRHNFRAPAALAAFCPPFKGTNDLSRRQPGLFGE